MNKPRFSICITSYNRPKELVRLLCSIDSKLFRSEIEVIIAEDLSPKRMLIKESVESFMQSSDLNVILHLNESNLGYDRNLGNLAKLANGDYIIYFSDDDTFIPNSLDKYLNIIEKERPTFCYSPFVTPTLTKRKYRETYNIEKGEESAKRHLSDFILFSGLTFNRAFIKDIDSSEFLNLNYFQVFLGLKAMYLQGALYIDVPLVDCKSDGENGFGLSKSSNNDVDLANRQSPYSNLKFHQGLIKVIRIFDKAYNTNIIDSFSRRYSLTSYYGMSRARHISKQCYAEYVNRLNRLGIRFNLVHYIYRIMINLFGANISDKLMLIPRKLLINILSKSKR